MTGAADVDAVILVGGMGTRLRPLTLSAPKPMLPTAGVPFLTHLVARIREAGVTHIVLGTSYRADVFESYFGDGSAFGVDIEYVVETEPLGTAGGIRNVAGRLRGETALVFNGDVLSGADLTALLATQRRTGADATLYLTKVDDPRAFGCVPTDADGRVTAFLEKTPDPVTNRINAGCYVFRRSVIDAIPTGRPVSVERETFPALLAAGEMVVGFVDTSYWLDLGTPEAYVTGCRDLVTGRAPSPAVAHAGESLVLPGASVAPDAWLSGGTAIGAGAVVSAGARVVGSVVFDGAQIGAGSLVENSVVGADAVIGEGCVIMDAVIGDGARVGARNELLRGARVWTGAVLADCAVRFSTDG
jgi:mannose-1-phosphate guanylyltransferase